MTPIEVAKDYAGRGWNPVPLPYKAKKPMDDGWQLRVITAADVPRFFNSAAGNVGVILAPALAA
jgi:hypothetical protein